MLKKQINFNFISKFDNYMVCSSSSQFSSICKSKFDGTIESIPNILESMNMNGNRYRVRKMTRPAE